MSYRAQQAPDESVRQLPVVNTAAEDVPAFALMHITGIDADGALLVGQPGVDGQTNLLLNGPVPIPPGAHGQGHSASPAAVLYDDADGTPAAGEAWGAAAGSWKARKGKAGALVVGGTDAAAMLTNVLHLWGLAPAGGGGQAAGVETVSWGADQADFAPASDTAFLVVDATADVLLHSLAGGADGRALWVINKSTLHTLTLIHESGSGSASMRLRLPYFAGIVLAPYEAWGLVYSADDGRWYSLDERHRHALLDGTIASDTAAASPAKGRLIAGTSVGAGFWSTVNVGADGKQLTADSGVQEGVSWQAPNLLSPSHGDATAGSPLKGSLIVGDNSTPKKWVTFPVGIDGQVLTASSGAAVGLVWAAAGGISLSAPNTWTATQTFNPGTSPTSAIVIGATPIGSAGTRNSHTLVWQAYGNNPTDHLVEWKSYAEVTGGAGASTFHLQSRVDPASFADRLTITDAGNGVFAGTLAASNLSGTNTGDQTLASLGATTVGSNFVTLANPSAVTFPRMNADNTVSALDAAAFRTAIGAASASGAYQPLDATLTSLAGLDPAGANNMIVSSTADAFTLLLLGANTFPARSSAGNVAAKTLTDFALTLLDDADAATARATLGAGTGSGTVTSFSAGDLAPLFTTTEATVTTTPALSFALNTQSANTLFAGPTTGAAAAPTFRVMVAADVPDGLITEAKQTLADNTTGNVSSTKHGYAPKSPADATQFLNGAATSAFAAVKGSDLSMSDVTTNDVSTTKHGFAPKAPADATKFLNGANPPAWAVPPGSPLDVTGLAATEPALDDQLPEYDTSATANRKAQVDRLLGLARRSPGGRLTLTSGDPAPASASAGSTLYYCPFLHDCVELWDGTRWVELRFPETGLALSVTSGSVYDVFAYLSSGALALETLAWTNATTRATAVTYQDGRLCKSGDRTRLYLGTLKASAANTTIDAINQRFLWNFYNPVERKLKAVESTTSWTYGTAAWRQANNAATNKVEFVLGMDRMVRAHVLVTVDVASTQQYSPGIGLDRTNGNDAVLSPTSYTGGAQVVRDTPTALYEGNPGVGAHYLAWLEYAASGIAATAYGFVSDFINSGISGSIVG